MAAAAITPRSSDTAFIPFNLPSLSCNGLPPRGIDGYPYPIVNARRRLGARRRAGQRRIEGSRGEAAFLRRTCGGVEARTGGRARRGGAARAAPQAAGAALPGRRGLVRGSGAGLRRGGAFRAAVDLGAAGDRRGLLHFRLHGAAARSGARQRAAVHARGGAAGGGGRLAPRSRSPTRFPAASPPPSSRAGISTITPNWARAKAIPSAPICRPSATAAG